jgi:hypothetical protein
MDRERRLVLPPPELSEGPSIAPPSKGLNLVSPGAAGPSAPLSPPEVI